MATTKPGIPKLPVLLLGNLGIPEQNIRENVCLFLVRLWSRIRRSRTF